jgi:WD40 repeat protein
MNSSESVVDVHRVSGSLDTEHAVVCVRYTCDGKYIFTASSSGVVSVAPEGDRPKQHFSSVTDPLEACTCVRLADVPADAESGAYSAVSTTSGGNVAVWSVVPLKSADVVAAAKEEGNEIMTCAVAPGGMETIVTGGSDTTLRFYRVAEGGIECVRKVEQGIDRHGQPTLGPPAKVMSSIFVDKNTVLVGGWEASVLLYDLRTGAVQRTFDGPRLTGDCLDVLDGCVLAASHRPKDQLQVFDLSSGKLLTSMAVDTLPFACRLFGRASKLGAWVAGTSSNSVFALDLLREKTVASVTDVPDALYALDVCLTDPQKVCIGGARDVTYRIRANF